MSAAQLSRRNFLDGIATSYWITARAHAAQSKNSRFVVAAIGPGGQGIGISRRAGQFGDIVRRVTPVHSVLRRAANP